MKKYVLLNRGDAMSKLAAIYINRIALPEDEVHSLYLAFGIPNEEAMKASARKIAENYCTSHSVMAVQMIIDGLKLTPTVYCPSTNDILSLPQITEDERKVCTGLKHYPYYKHKCLLEGLAFARNIVYADFLVAGHIHNLTEENITKFYDSVCEKSMDFRKQGNPKILTPFFDMQIDEILESMGLDKETISDTVNQKDIDSFAFPDVKVEGVLDADNP